MKRHKPYVEKLLTEGPKGFRDAWHLGTLHEEYKRLKKKYQQFQKEEEQQKQTKYINEKSS